MDNEKKSSCFGVRLSAIVVAVFLVVCMAVPAFASEGSIDPSWPEFPDGSVPLVIDFGKNIWLYDISNVAVIGGQNLYPGIRFTFKDSNSANISVPAYVLLDGSWSKQGEKSELTVSDIASASEVNVIYSLYDLEFGSSSINVVVPPPPDPLESVGNGLVVVMDWVGSVVSAVVSGPMSGLLILLAVPVAITLLLVAFIVIRRIIWGA